MVWKVAGELVIPKNITCGSKRPWFVMNAAFHWSPSCIRVKPAAGLRAHFVRRGKVCGPKRAVTRDQTPEVRVDC
jgi:hypothetical protein